MRSNSRHTDISTDREARLQLVLDDARSYVNSAAERLRQAGVLARHLPRTCPELTWKLLLVQTLRQTDSLSLAIELLAQAREDVVDLRH